MAQANSLGSLHPGTAPSRRRSFNWLLVVLLGVVGLAGVMAITTYNSLVGLDQAVQAQWAQVENVYQRRADLVPNLVETVKGAAAFEQQTLTAVTEARASVGQLSEKALARITTDPQAFARFQAAQDTLSAALTRLFAVSERYPELTATQNFRDLQAQLEGTENRIAVERMRFNDAARTYNTRRQRFPTNVLAGLFGDRFASTRPYFEATKGAETPPAVRF